MIRKCLRAAQHDGWFVEKTEPHASLERGRRLDGPICLPGAEAIRQVVRGSLNLTSVPFETEESISIAPPAACARSCILIKPSVAARGARFLQALEIETYAVVPHHQKQAVSVFRQPDEDLSCLCMSHYVSQRFLRNSEACGFELPRKAFFVIRQFDHHFNVQPGASCVTIDVPAKRGDQSEIVQHRRTEFNGKIANQAQCFINCFDIVLDIRAYIGRVVEPAVRCEDSS